MKLPIQTVDLFWMSTASWQYPAPKKPFVPTYRVGELLQQGRRRWPVATQYTYGPNGHELTLFLEQIDQQVIHDIRAGEAEFAVIVQLPVLVLAFRFGKSISWRDVPFCVHMQPSHCRNVPPLGDSQKTRALLWVTLVGAHDGLIYAQRGMTLAPEFTRTLHQAIRDQAALPFCPDDCLVAMSDLFVNYPDINDRLLLAQAHTRGSL